jgi:hypothetical protein
VALKHGKYTVWFRTPVGEGAGVVELSSDGKLSGGDSTFAYTGHWGHDADRFEATIHAKRFALGPPGVFGMDEIDRTVVGYTEGGVTASCTGFAAQSPGLKLDVTLIRIKD